MIKIQLVDNAQWVIDTFGKMIGYVSCSVGDDTENKYISFEDMYSTSKS